MKYPGQESSILEFKQELPTKQELVKTVIGFCNLYGGRLVIGVDDRAEILGIPEDDVGGLIESLQQSIYNSCTPTIIADIHTQRIDEKLLLIIDVSEGMNKPYFHTSKGVDGGTYLRMGKQTMRATAEIIQELHWQSKGKSPDMRPVYHSTIEDLDMAAIDRFFKNRIQKPEESSHVSREELMIHYKILVKEHQRIYPSMAGILLFGKKPQDHISEAFIIGTHFKGVSGRDVLATKDFTKTLFDQFEESISFVVSRLNRQFTIKGAGPRNEQLELPEVALREILLNAIIHRNYFLSGPTKIAIYDDRIEVFSPGTFPGPLNASNLEMGLTYIRNFIISRIMRESGYVEKLGTGFLTLFKTYREAHLPEPIVIEGAGFVKCILQRRTPKQSARLEEPMEQQLMKLFLMTDEVQTGDVVRFFSISRATAGRLLAKLVLQGIIVKTGQGPATRYKRN